MMRRRSVSSLGGKTDDFSEEWVRLGQAEDKRSRRVRDHSGNPTKRRGLIVRNEDELGGYEDQSDKLRPLVKSVEAVCQIEKKRAESKRTPWRSD